MKSQEEIEEKIEELEKNIEYWKTHKTTAFLSVMIGNNTDIIKTLKWVLNKEETQ